MVIDNLNIGGAALRPDKANAPLPVYPHRVLPCPVTFQFFQMVARWKPQVLHNNRCIKRREHRPSALHQVTGEAFAAFAFNGFGSEFVLGASDHVEYVSWCETCIKM